jgi:LemA protein
MHPGEIIVTAAIAFAVVGLIGYGVSIYNGLIAMKNNIGRSWANIDVLLKQRHDELPKLVKTCEQYMKHERAVFDKLSEARAALMGARSVGERAEAEGMLTRALGKMFAVAEAYPNLKADQSFLQLQSRISQIENQIADRREFYNDSIAIYNARIEQVPDVFFARLLGYAPRDMYKVAPAETVAPDITFSLPKAKRPAA